MSLHARIIEIRDTNPTWLPSKIAAKVQCHPSYVRLAIQRASVLREDQPKERRYLQDWEICCVVESYKAGVKLESIATEFCVTASCVSLTAKRAGLPRRKNRGPTKSSM